MPRPEFDQSASIRMISPNNHWHHEVAVGIAAVTIDMTAQPINNIAYLLNDDPANDLFVSYDDTPVGIAPTNGANGVQRIKSGGGLADVPRFTRKINMIRTAGNGVIRFMGV